MPTEYGTLVEALEDRRQGSAAVNLIEGAELEVSLSLAELHDRALVFLGQLQQRGVEAGDRVILSTGSNERMLVSLWACLLGAVVPVPLAVGLSDEHRVKVLRIAERLQEPWLLLDERSLERLRKHAEKTGTRERLDRWDERTFEYQEFSDGGAPGQVTRAEPNDLALIQFSSGSTSDPKGVLLSHRNLIATVVDMEERCGYTPQDVGLNWMPLTHDMGLVAFHLNMVVSGMEHHILPTELFSRRPLLWLTKTAEKRATILGSPNFGYKHVLRAIRSKGAPADLDLSTVRVLMNGAEPISVPLCHEFLDALEPHGLRRSAMMTVYGLAEAGVGVSIPEPAPEFQYLTLRRDALNVADAVVAVPAGDAAGVAFPLLGPPMRRCRVRVVDDEGETLPEDRVGHVQISGPNVTRGYFGDPDANRAAFTDDGWVDTGDLGLLHAGQVVITGRAKDIIFVHGQNYYPHDLENALIGEDALELGKVAAAGWRPAGGEADEVLVFVLFRSPVEEFVDVATLTARQVNEQIGIEVSRVVPVRKIPKTTSGKVQRHSLVADYERGEFEQVLTELDRVMAAREGVAREEGESGGMARTLLEIAREALPDHQIGLADNLFEVGISSLDLAQIHERLDALHPGVVDIVDLFDHPTLGDLATFVEVRLASE